MSRPRLWSRPYKKLTLTPIPRLSLNTGKEMLSIRQHIINTKSTSSASRKEYIRRCEMGEIAYKSEMGNPLQTASWMRALEETIIPPQSITTVKAFVDAPLDPSDSHSFLSRFEKGVVENSVVIPSITNETSGIRQKM